MKTAKHDSKDKNHKINWTWLIFGVIFVITVVLAICLNLNFTNNSSSKILSTLDIDNSDLKINWDKYQTTNLELSEISTITESGTYHLTGILTGAPIIIDSDAGEIRLILDNINVENPSGPAIFCSNASDLVIELVGENVLQDGAVYENYDEDVSGVIYSKADLFFSGEGKLTINAKNQNAIKGKDDIKFTSGIYNIDSEKDAIHGKDSVYFVGGDFSISAKGNAIESTNETDYGKGFILVENGDFDISADGKGFKSIKNLLFYGGDINIASFDDSIHSDNFVGVIGGNISIESGDDGIHANKELIIDGGDINITKSNEGIEAQIVTINNGKININSLDDGINAGSSTDENSSDQTNNTIAKNTANNQAGPVDPNADESCILTINGGEIYINATGDGIDSNGYIIFNGGKTIVDGPTDNGNGALDSGLGINMQGGEVIAIGSSGMAESLGNDGGVCNLSIYFNKEQSADTKVEIRDSDGNIIVSHTSAKTFSHASIGSGNLTLGNNYSIYLSDEKYSDFTITSVSTTVGNGNRNFQNFPNNNPRR